MKKVLLSCLAVAAGSAMAMAQALPEFPEKLDFTLNGEKELPGVTVTQEIVPYEGDDYLTYNITGESDAKEITIELITPEGWDGFVVSSNYDGGGADINPLKAKAKAPAKEGDVYWMDLMFASYWGGAEGNTITLPVDGEEWDASAFLVKGDQIYMIQFDFVFEVTYTGVNDDPDDPEVPETPKYPASLDFTLNGEKELSGVSVNQVTKAYNGIDYLVVEITGESTADAITMDFETPAGWDYALIDSEIAGSSSPWNTRSDDSEHWVPVKAVTSMGYKKGNSFEFPVNGKDNYGTIYLVKGDYVWEFSIDIEINVKKAEGSGDDEEPAYPEALDFTINGEKELAGVKVEQEYSQDSLSISLTGTSTADEITLTFDTPNGWDGFLIAAPFADLSEIEFAKTRSAEDWMTLEEALNSPYGFQSANSITFPVDEEGDNFAWMALVKGDKVYNSIIDINFDVKPAPASDEPVFPESFVVTTFNKGLEVSQGYNKWGNYDITVEGEVAENTFPIVIDVPEGWDGFVCYNWSHQGDVTITESDPTPKATRAEEMEWISVEKLLANGYEKGNRFTFEPTYVPGTNNYQTIELHLYKGDMAMKEDILSLLVYVSKGEVTAPEFPSEFDVTATGDDVTVWQGATAELPEGTLTEDEAELTSGWFNCESAVMVSGKTASDSTTVEFNLPEGWAGVQPFKITIPDFNDYEYLSTRANESDWQMLDEMTETLGSMGYFDTSIEGGTKFDFAAGEKQAYLCYLYMDMEDADETVKLADTANAFVLVVNVEKDGDAPALTFPDEFDVSLSSEGITVSQELEVYHGEGQFIITLEGECSEDELTVTLAVPEGWDGFIGASDYDDPYEIEPLSTRSELNEYLWMPVSGLEGIGYKKCDSLKFNVDGDEHGGYMFLYKGDMAYYCAILIEDLVMPAATVGVDSVESAAPARYYNLQGAEVSNPESGVYVKVVDGKSYKVIVK